MTLGRLLHYGIYLAWTLLAGLLVHLSTWEMPPDLPFVYVITPTYRRPTQKADLTRLANTLGQVPNLHWIVVEDSDKRSPMVAGVLSRCRAPNTHMNVPMPSYCKPHCVARGTEQRNMGLDWLRKNRGPVDSGVVYFGDDDNAYDLEVFEEIRSTKRVSVFPVGLIAGRWYERPKVRDGRVVGWYTGYGGRKFCIDMAGFAVNLHVLLAKPNARFVMKGVGGVQETDFLSLPTKVEDLEPLANNCTRIGGITAFEVDRFYGGNGLAAHVAGVLSRRLAINFVEPFTMSAVVPCIYSRIGFGLAHTHTTSLRR